MKFITVLLISFYLIFICGCEPDPVDTPGSTALRDTTIKNIAYGSNNSQQFDLGLPANRTTATPLVVVVHGGGWATGDKNELNWMLNGLKQRGFAVANINYRLALNQPDNYKMQIDDIDSAVQHVLRLASTYIFNGQKLYITGHSAGGHLAMSYAYTRNNAGKVKAVSSLAGPANLYSMSYYNFNIYNPILQPYLGVPLFPASPAATQRYQDCSPYYQATASAPPTIFFHGESDPVVFTDQSTGMYGKLGTLAVGRKIILYPFTFHDWWTDGNKTANTLDEMKVWFNTYQ